jgi:hypothetical protein
MVVAQRREELRAADVDRQFVADRLKAALDEGRLSLQEYDDRLKDTYAARTYGDLDKLLADLPGVERQQLVPQPPVGAHPVNAASPVQRDEPRGRTRWLAPVWGTWLTVVLITNAVWLATVLFGGHAAYWPVWVMLPWGAVLLAGTIGAGHGGRRAYHDARREARRQRRRDRRGY